MSTTYGLSYKKNYSGVQPGAVLSKVHKKTECSTSSTATSTASDKRFRGKACTCACTRHVCVV